MQAGSAPSGSSAPSSLCCALLLCQALHCSCCSRPTAVPALVSRLWRAALTEQSTDKPACLVLTHCLAELARVQGRQVQAGIEVVACSSICDFALHVVMPPTAKPTSDTLCLGADGVTRNAVIIPVLDSSLTPYLGGGNGYQIPQARGNSRETAGYYSVPLQDSTRTQPTIIATQVLTGSQDPPSGPSRATRALLKWWT